ncbi:MAG: GAF domain-containing protein, partial [Gemmatimonadota bacterium]
MTGSVAGLCDLDSALLTLLPDMSGALLRVSPRQMDAEIEGWLERLVGLLSVDRITLLQMSAEGSGLHSTHSAAATGAPPPFPVVATEGELTWLVQQVRHGRLVQSPDLPRGLPYSAGRERVLVARAGLKSLALVPFAIGGSGLGAMALSSTRAHPAFPDAVMARLELAAQVIGGALARQRTRQTLEARIAFEHLLTDLVASVVGATAIELDTRIQHGLASVIGHLGIDSCSILRFSDDHASLSRTHYATAPGISPIRPAIEFPWYLERMRAGRVTQYTQNVADLPDAAAPEQDYLRERGVQTHVSIPLAAAGRPWGAIGSSAILRPRLWSDE